MALSSGQVESVLRRAGVDTGRTQEFTSRGDLEGASGQEKLFRELTGGGGGFSGGGGTDFTNIAAETLRLQRKANIPAVESLRASIPETQERFAERGRTLEAEREPLKQRYQAILDDLTSRETKETSATQRATTREFAGRGLLPTGGGFEQFLGERLQPAQQFFTGQRTTAGIESEAAQRELANLIAGVPLERQQSEREITQAIADLQAGGASQSIQTALSILQSNRAQQQFAQTQALSERTAGLAERQFETGEARQQALDPFDIQLLQAQIKRQQQLSAGGAGDITSGLESLFQQFGG